MTNCLADETNCVGNQCTCVVPSCKTTFPNRQCGTVPIGCTSTTSIECGNCPGDWRCDSGGTHECFCPTLSEANCGGKCGTISNNCGNNHVCQTQCPTNTECVSNACQCTANSCKSGEDRYCHANGTCLCSSMDFNRDCNGKCGIVSNRCGNEIDCGSCLTSDEQCVNNVCTCDSISCPAQGCGVVANSCNLVQCPVTCTSPDTCLNNTCQCVAGTCQSLGKQCGTHTTCSSQITCPQCTNNFICTQDGSCIDPNCSPVTSCATAGRSCGLLWTGCANATCGICQGGQICKSGKCGCNPPDPTFCANIGGECGDVNDGCNTFSCGTCQPGLQCISNKCRNATVTSATAGEPAAAEDSAGDGGADGLQWWIFVAIGAGVLCILIAVAGFVLFKRNQSSSEGSDSVSMKPGDDSDDEDDDVLVYDKIVDVVSDSRHETEVHDDEEVTYASLDDFRQNPEDDEDDEDEDDDEEDEDEVVVYAAVPNNYDD
jgi:hypothetical protein